MAFAQVTSKSGFSHLAATLCAKPAVLAVPFWLSYACVPRAVPLTASTQSFEDTPAGASVELDAAFAFDEAKLLRLLDERPG